MSEKRCPFCHEWVDAREFPAHRRTHTQLQPNGQQHAYITLPPDEREFGPLDGVPRWYRHARCGHTTGMPEENVRSYLKNPFLYSDSSHCTGCRGQVPMRELTWVETGENVKEYMDRLRAEHPELHPQLGVRLVAPLLKWFRGSQ